MKPNNKLTSKVRRFENKSARRANRVEAAEFSRLRFVRILGGVATVQGARLS